MVRGQHASITGKCCSEYWSCQTYFIECSGIVRFVNIYETIWARGWSINVFSQIYKQIFYVWNKQPWIFYFTARNNRLCYQRFVRISRTVFPLPCLYLYICETACLFRTREFAWLTNATRKNTRFLKFDEIAGNCMYQFAHWLHRWSMSGFYLSTRTTFSND